MSRPERESPEAFNRRMEIQARIIKDLVRLLPQPPFETVEDNPAADLITLFALSIESPPEARYYAAGGSEMRKSFRAGAIGRFDVRVNWNSRAIRIEWDVSKVSRNTAISIQFLEPQSRRALSKIFDAGSLAKRRWVASAEKLGFSPRQQWILTLKILKTP